MAHQMALKNFTAIVNRHYHVNLKPNQVDASELYDKCCAKETGLRKKISVDAYGSVDIVKQAMRRAAPYLQCRDGKSTSELLLAGSVSKGAGKGKGEPQLQDMVLAEDEVFYIDGEPAPIIDLDNMLHDTCGVAYTSATKAGIALRKAQDRPIRRPCIVVCKKMAFEACSAVERKEVLTHFKPITMTLYFREPRGPPRPSYV